MAVSSPPSSPASRSFVVGPYRTTEAGTFVEHPACCPIGLERGESASCQTRFHRRRTRKIGIPWGWVAVFYCKTHGRYFTVYPPGFTPHGRTPLVVLAPDGSEPMRGPSEGDPPPTEGYLSAAQDAAEGVRWPRDGATDSAGGVRSTQRRRVARIAQMLGLVSDQPPTPSAVAGVTGVPEGRLVETARTLGQARGLRAWGQSVMLVIGALARQAGRTLMDKLAVLGHLAGRWGRPYRWEPGLGRLIGLGQPFWSLAPVASPPLGTLPDPQPERGAKKTNDFGPRLRR